MHQTSATPSPLHRTELARFSEMYKRTRFLDIYQETRTLWSPETKISTLNVEETVFAARLALRLGGAHLSRWLYRSARKRWPEHPLVRYYSWRLIGSSNDPLDELRALENASDLGGEDIEVRAHWFSSRACVWAALRDFSKASQFIQNAYALLPNDDFVMICEADVLAKMDRRADALALAERAWQLQPAAPYVLESLALLQVRCGMSRKACETLATAARTTQSFDIALAACHHHCRLAETLNGIDRLHVLRIARQFSEKLLDLAPLADSKCKQVVAQVNFDIASLAGDYSGLGVSKQLARSSFHRQVLQNVQRNVSGARIRLPFTPREQRDQECVPTAIAMAASASGVEISLDRFASDVSCGGTYAWAAVDWLREHGLHVRVFRVTSRLALDLLRRGIAFAFMLDDDEIGHAVAAIGFDEAAETLLVQDPLAVGSAEYLLTFFDEGRSPLGVIGIAAVASERKEELDGLLPPEAAVVEASQKHIREIVTGTPSSARAVVQKISREYPGHAGVSYLQAIQLLEDGNAGQALRHLQELSREFPISPSVRVQLVNAYRRLENSSQLLEILKNIVEYGSADGQHSAQKSIDPHPQYVCEYADMLRLSDATRNRARTLLLSLLKRRWDVPQAWHTLANLLWTEDDRETALIAFRIASVLSESNEVFANSYADALCHCGRSEEGFGWLEKRVAKYGDSLAASSARITWISLLERWGQPRRAFAGYRAGIDKHGNDGNFLAFAVGFLARMGLWREAEEALRRLSTLGEGSRFYEASVEYHRMQGELGNALQLAAKWVAESPGSIRARSALLDLMTATEGSSAALLKAKQWMCEHPDSEKFEELYCRQLDGSQGPMWPKLRILKRRVQRNVDDGWAWRELTFSALTRYQLIDERKRLRFRPEIEALLKECDRTSANNAATLRARGLWLEAQRQWSLAVQKYKEAIEREPEIFFAYQRSWECAARLTTDRRLSLWADLESLFLRTRGDLVNCNEMINLVVRRFGVRDAERTLTRWREKRPDDPNIIEASANLLLDYGRGREDAEKALSLLSPAVDRFPHHIGLLFALGNTKRALADHAGAAQTLRELVRRHPDNLTALLQLAWTQSLKGEVIEGFATLLEAERKHPRNPGVVNTRARMLMRGERYEEARTVLRRGVEQLPESLGMRKRAINLLQQCGSRREAERAAREGVEIFPRRAYAWMLLGDFLFSNQQSASPEEIEYCFRQSLQLNSGMFASAERLSIFLTMQKRYEEALEVLAAIEPSMADPSPALGRAVWILREKGLKSVAVDQMAELVADAQWYSWGWEMLVEWLRQDGVWQKSMQLLNKVAPPMASNFQFRLQRLKLLANAGAEKPWLEAECRALLRDFPDSSQLNLVSLLEKSSQERGKKAVSGC